MEQEEQFPDTECGSTSETSADSGELQFQEYQSVIADTQAYQWLVGRLQREFVWSSSDRSSMDAVRHKVICSLPSSRKVHRRTPPDKFKVEYFIPWDPIAFVGEQGYNIDITDVIENAITLTGTSIDAQALTCLEYVKQTWTDGEDILLAIKMAAKQWLPDSTHIAVYIDRSSLCVSTIGPADSVAEVGEQLAWLGGALRASPDELGVASFMPTVVGTHLYTSSEDSDLKATLRCHIDFEMVCPSQRSNGMCWHDIFRNPVVVKGYPTRHRPETNTGLETSLELLQELSQARYTTTVGGKLFLKGFSTLLVPARITGSVVVWHLYFNPDGSHISYVDARVEHVLGLHPKGLEPHHLQQARHILGWCAEAQALVGAPSANYDITWSGLEVTRTGSSEGMASIYQRRTVGATAKAAIGLKDRAEHLNPNEYIAQLMWIAKRFVVLYDVEKKQAWLTDGASALLHLVQASLKETETGDFAHRFIYRIEAIQKAPGYMDGKTAAITMLESDYNRKLRLYTNMDELFEDRVDRVYHALELALARQVLIGREGSGPLRAVDQLPWRLKGFDFMDVATEDCFAPREVIYPSTAPVWLELTEAIENVTLFGCGTWGLVPTGKDYLAACVSDIKQIMKRRGNDRIKPWRVVEGVFWHMPDKAFGECQCSTRSLTVPCSRVQVLVSHEDLKQMGEKVKSPALLADHGAVIFGDSPGPGHSLASAHQAPIHEKVGPYVRNDSPFYDSGIGTSSRSASSSSFRRSKDTPKRPLSPDTPLGDAKRRSSHMLCSDSTRLNDFQETGKADSRNLGKSHDVTSGCTPFCSQARAALPPASFLEISNQNLLRREEYRIGWISALKRHQPILGHSSDYNLYVQGQIGIHNVVLTCLPEGHYGTNAAATVATRMMNTYPNIHIGFMVGIGGGLPSPQNDIRLGDVIVSRPEREHGGVVQYDMGKFTVDGFQRTGFLNAPPERLLAVLNIMPEHDEPLPRCRTATYPGVQLDRLFRPTYKHVTSDQTCIDCSETEALKRGPGNREAGPHVYYGTIASGNMVIKDAGARDLLVQKHGVLCFEMEAAGLMNTNFPCLVIRGVSDYADSHKNDVWKKYAAASAAEYARSLICAIPGNMYSK
ncbi:hypothetical protein BDV33DRAFT_229570 [Aspergillus novoparasiticus]|uniref:Nucleoside phosphorylase domain-containing protein n=1 Tax=Aspergillus novoparasiticus TaxID=986946 RepID=A0A5N6F040_9EURO|nr:hypothetical protein BDV33DRAFT_229570 [Aspergillus novoparasiticus]